MLRWVLVVLTLLAVLVPTAPIANAQTFTFVRAINVGGTAQTIDGNAWTAGTGATNWTLSAGGSFCDQGVALTPATDTARATMIRCSANNVSFARFTGLTANTTYRVWFYTWEDDAPNTQIDISLNGTVVQSNYVTGSPGTWAKLGPYDVTLGASTTQVELAFSADVPATFSSFNLSGVELWQAGAGPTSTPTATATATATRTATATATATNTLVPPTNTSTSTPIPPTATASATAVPPTNTPTASNTPVSSPTNTATSVGATDTPTSTPVSSATSMPTLAAPTPTNAPPSCANGYTSQGVINLTSGTTLSPLYTPTGPYYVKIIGKYAPNTTQAQLFWQNGGTAEELQIGNSAIGDTFQPPDATAFRLRFATAPASPSPPSQISAVYCALLPTPTPSLTPTLGGPTTPPTPWLCPAGYILYTYVYIDLVSQPLSIAEYVNNTQIQRLVIILVENQSQYHVEVRRGDLEPTSPNPILYATLFNVGDSYLLDPADGYTFSSAGLYLTSHDGNGMNPAKLALCVYPGWVPTATAVGYELVTPFPTATPRPDYAALVAEQQRFSIGQNVFFGIVGLFFLAVIALRAR